MSQSPKITKKEAEDIVVGLAQKILSTPELQEQPHSFVMDALLVSFSTLLQEYPCCKEKAITACTTIAIRLAKERHSQPAVNTQIH